MSISLTAACSHVEQGTVINYVNLDRLTLGISTQDTVKEVFGYPQFIDYPDDRTIYKYRFFKKTFNERIKQGVDFSFNKQQRLIDITINDATNFDKLGE